MITPVFSTCTCKEKEDQTERLAVGRINRLFVHRLYKSEDAPLTVFVDAEWYELVGHNDINGLLQIRRNPCFDAAPFADIKTCIPINCVFWRSTPFEQMTDESLYDVITHYDGWSEHGVRLRPYLKA